MMMATELLVLFLFPAFIVRLTKKVDFFGKVGGIIFRHPFEQRFKQNAFRTVRDDFRSRHNVNAVVF